MKKSMWYWLVAVLVVAVALVYLTQGGASAPGFYDEFAKCVANSGAKMYGAYWCPHCADQKKMFGSSAKYLPYVECDPRGNNADEKACDAAGVKGFPTWTFSDGTKNEGDLSLRQLAIRTNCTLPESE